MRRKAGTAVGILGLAQGFVGIGVAFLPAEPNLTLAKWMFVGAVVFIIAALLIFLWPQGAEETTQSATQSGSGNVQIQGQTVHFQGTISTGEGEVPTGRLPDGRVLVDVTPQYLTDFFREHTDIQAKKLLEAFIGKWMRLSGPVGDVYANDESNATVYFYPSTYRRTQILMYFNDKPIIEDRLRVLKKGDRITVIGQIDWASPRSLELDNCELEKP
jgi:hypothetical protein